MTDVRRVDSKGRLLIPKTLREKTEIFEGSYVKIEADGNRIIIQLTESAARRHYGKFKLKSVPDDLVGLLKERFSDDGWTNNLDD